MPLATSSDSPTLAALVTSKLRTPRIVAVLVSALILGAAAIFSVVRATQPEITQGAPGGAAAEEHVSVTDATELPVTVHVVGAVNKPGVYELAAGARVHDAIERAGGTHPDAASTALNLARTLVDGEQIIVPTAAEFQAMTQHSESMGAQSGGAGGFASPTNLNTASLEQLDSLPGIGPALAQRILDWRGANGSFRSVDQLGEVSGIGAKLVDTLRPLVTI